MNDKKCKYCGTIENLCTRTMKTGQVFILNICKECHSSLISKTTKKAMSELPEDKKEKCQNAFKNFWETCTEEQKQKILEKRSNSIKESDKTNNRKEKISEYWKTCDNSIIEEKTKKQLETINNKTEEERNQTKEKQSISMSFYCQSDDGKEQRSKSSKKMWSSKSEEEKEEINKKRSISYKESYSLLSKEEKEIRSQNMKTVMLNLPEETKKRRSEKLSIANVKRIERAIFNRTHRTSKVEVKCLEYIRENIDENVQYQVTYKHNHDGRNRYWIMDFYLPKFDLYVNLDGVYWHGHSTTNEKLKETKMGKAILKCKEKDILQNQVIDNLVRISDVEFNKNPFTLNRIIEFRLENDMSF
jgi:hypothetical protein